MNTSTLVRTALIAIFLLGASTISLSQAPPATSSASPEQIIYTGKLLGYFRLPSLQSRTNVAPCQEFEATDSKEATEFLKLRRQRAEAILVGTGDNFAPRLEGRTFAEVNSNTASNAKDWYRPR